MRTILRRHLGKLIAGTAIALTGTAAAVAVALPDAADAGERQSSAQGLAVAPPGVVEAAPAEGAKGTGSDPLTDAEVQRAERIATGGKARLAARDVRGARGPQHLSTTLGEPEPGATATGRSADVLFYDYDSDAVIARTVDLATGKVQSDHTERGIQPPAAKAELAEAARLLMADPLGAGLEEDYRDATGKDLTAPKQLELSSFVFRKETVEQVPPALESCGEHRCMRLVAKVVNGPWIDLRDLVVDLSARKVTRLP